MTRPISAGVSLALFVVSGSAFAQTPIAPTAAASGQGAGAAAAAARETAASGGISVFVPSGAMTGLPGVAPRCYSGPGFPPYPGYGPNPTYPPMPGAFGYYPTAGYTQVIVQLGLFNNLALGSNSTATLGTASLLDKITSNAQSADPVKQALLSLEAARKADHETLERLIQLLAERLKQAPEVAPQPSTPGKKKGPK